MEEILIGEKKYVSSKRAAKITGYAKDYVGQLCREGRVPARLVGRSWYVLESAIQDHRFGAKDEAAQTKPEQKRPTDTWEAPRYEAAQAAPLPAVNKLRPEEELADVKPQDSVEHLQNAWQSWFDRVQSGEMQADMEVEVAEESATDATEDVTEPADEGESLPAEEDKVPVPIRAIYTPPLEKPAPVVSHMEEFTAEEEIEESAQEPTVSHRSPGRVMAALRIAGIACALVSVALAAVGSGYMDEYIISNSQARMVAGVSLYNK